MLRPIIDLAGAPITSNLVRSCQRKLLPQSESPPRWRVAQD